MRKIKEKIYLYNTMSRKKEEFKPINESEVGLYTCGPTVYHYAHLGNLRSYVFADILKRVLKYNSYKVKHVMNITDVGHLTGDRDMGEDKLEKGAKREGKTAKEVIAFFTKQVLEDMANLNILRADVICPATENIPEQIAMIKKLEEKGYTYKTSDGIYFDTTKFPNYNKLSHLKLDDLEEGARVEKNEEKKHSTDFALWKFSPKNEKRQQEWESPWGIGFPGWHIECSAMSVKYLGEQFDIHTGAVDLINIHHSNEIAQTEAVTKKIPWVRYWMHGGFLNLDQGRKMSKSSGDIITLNNELIDKGINPLVFRFLTLQTHYRKPMEFTQESTRGAQNSFTHLQNQVKDLGTEIGKINKDYKQEFLNAINDDLNMPQALAVVQRMLKSDLSNEEKLATVLDLDKVLGLDLDKIWKKEELPKEIEELRIKRESARKEKKWAEADKLRIEIESKGYKVEDVKDGMRIIKK